MSKTNLEENIKTKIFSTILGVLVGLGGMAHGVFATIQGNIPTEGFYLKITGAFSLIPNYLISGVVAIFLGVLIVFWSITKLDKKYGPLIFLALSIILFFVGGGIAQTVYFLITFFMATQINSPLNLWKRVLSSKIGVMLGKLWTVLFISGFTFLLIGVFIWLILVPPGKLGFYPEVNKVLMTFLYIGISLQLLTIVSGFSSDIERKRKLTQHPVNLRAGLTRESG